MPDSRDQEVPMSAPSAIAQQHAIAAVRRFSRFYTSQLGLLGEGLLNSEFSLTEARVLYELAHRETPTATDLCRDLGLDAGYLSRILKAFERRGLVTRAPSPHDGRQALLTLTQAGRAAFAPLDRASQEDVRTRIGRLTPMQTADLVAAMHTVEQLMGEAASPGAGITLRGHRLGDLGWIAHRQAVLYAQEYGWDASYEVLAAEILAGFAKSHDPCAERSWIAERDGTVVGSVFVMRASETVAKLRLLYVEPSARGLGLGRQLVDACIGFARDRGYRTLTLWTNDVLVPARRIYQQAGFTCVAAEPHRSFGKELVGETWQLAL
jgi:DNA-binding MarR family transcriptional regulator/N-acetylglutamate synthase-like GNAT family acetyltransferase